MTLAEALAAAALELDGVRVIATESGAEWTLRGRTFAAVDGPRAEFRLDPTIVRAALGTADTAPSRRGPEWIAFSPAELDRFALDRATSWFAAAHRRAGGALD